MEFYRPGASEVIVPAHINTRELGYSDGTLTEQEIQTRERAALDRLQQEMPVPFADRAPTQLMPEIAAAWEQFQISKGRQAGSKDLTLIEDFAFGRNFAWEDQFIGSCVISNTFRQWVKRAIFQIALCGESCEYFGVDEFGPNSIAPYAPWSYGMMRRRGGLRSGDGGFCEPMGASLLKDGVLPCSSPKLKTLLSSLNAYSLKDLPEPRSNDVYRQFGAWKHLDALAPDACCPLLDTDVVTSIDQHMAFEDAYKPMFQCSMIAVRKVGTHKDGFDLHVLDTRDTWAHNMGWAGMFLASDGQRIHRLSNESWGDEVIYNIPSDELEKWYRARRVSTMTIGQIALRQSLPSAA